MMLKRLAAGLLAGCMMLPMTAPVVQNVQMIVHAGDEQIYNDYLLYRDMGDYIEITGCNHLDDYDYWLNDVNWRNNHVVYIPETIQNKRVTSIAEGAFVFPDAPQKHPGIRLPRFIEHIADGALVNIPDNYSYYFEIMLYGFTGEKIECPVLKLFGDADEVLDILGRSYFTYSDDGILTCITDMAHLQGNLNSYVENSQGYQFHFEFSLFEPAYSINIGDYHLQYPQKRSSSSDSTIGRVEVYNSFHEIVDATSSVTYNPELAEILCVTAQSAYDEECVRFNYNAFGFRSQTGVYDYETTYTQPDNCGYVIGFQDLPDGTREYLITVRGTANKIWQVNGEEWWSDFNLGFSQIDPYSHYPKTHHGFEEAAERVIETINRMNGNTVRTNKVRYVITGHSRGAAVGNLVAKYLIDQGVSKKDLYAYLFACPGVAIDIGGEFTASKYASIFSLNCSRDLVGQAPGEKLTLLSPSFWETMWGNDPAIWSRYGMTYYWDFDWNSSGAATISGLPDYHAGDTNYVPYFKKQYGLNDFKTFDSMKQQQKENKKYGRVSDYIYKEVAISDFNATVWIKDSLGNLVASIKDGMLTFATAMGQMADKIHAQVVDGRMEIQLDSEGEYQLEIESDDPNLIIGIAQESENYPTASGAAVYEPSASEGSVTVDLGSDVPPSQTPVKDGSGESVAPDKIWSLGDVNGDGALTVADAVALQKWLLGVSDAALSEWSAADFDGNARLNAADLTYMKRELLKN